VPGSSTFLRMTEVIFNRIAPVVAVHDLDAALARYRRLGFATELDEPAQYGFVERGAVQLHLVREDPDDPGETGGVVYVYVSDADSLHAEWASAGVDGRFMGPHNTPYGLREFVYTDPDGIVHRVGSPL
jgi:Glyoxalase/Bleomycin resistance protein/Dioxygenase superfamily